MCIFTNAVLSLCIGFGMYTSALVGFVAMMMCMYLFPSLETRLKGRSPQFEMHLELKNRNLLQEFVTAIREFGLHLDDIEINPAYATTGLGVYTVKVTISDRKLLSRSHDEIIDALAALDSVEYVEEMK